MPAAARAAGAKQMAAVDERRAEKRNCGTCSEDDQRQDGGGGPVGERSGERKRILGASRNGSLLAVGVGVGEQAADGQQKDGAEAEIEPSRHHQAGGFAHCHRCHQQEKQCHSPGPAGGAADGQKHKRQQRKEGVDAQFHTHPPAQGD
jgi:hypothetical protein